VVGFGLMIFAFSTMLAWSYYGQVCFEYIFGVKGVMPYRLIPVVFIFIGGKDQRKLWPRFRGLEHKTPTPQ